MDGPLVNVQTTRKIAQIFVAFSEKLNYTDQFKFFDKNENNVGCWVLIVPITYIPS